MAEMKKYVVDYDAYDLKSLFSVRKAALLWFDLEIIEEAYRKRVDMLEKELIIAVQNGILKYRTPQDHLKTEAELFKLPKIFNDFTDCLSREDLRAWAISRGQKPKFLFPEDRGAEFHPKKDVILPMPEKKETALRPNQIHKIRCQAVASMLWAQNINYTQKEIAAHPDMKKHGYQNGSYDKRTIEFWISKVDPRPVEVRKTPYSKKTV